MFVDNHELVSINAIGLQILKTASQVTFSVFWRWLLTLLFYNYFRIPSEMFQIDGFFHPPPSQLVDFSSKGNTFFTLFYLYNVFTSASHEKIVFLYFIKHLVKTVDWINGKKLVRFTTIRFNVRIHLKNFTLLVTGFSYWLCPVTDFVERPSDTRASKHTFDTFTIVILLFFDFFFIHECNAQKDCMDMMRNGKRLVATEIIRLSRHTKRIILME